MSERNARKILEIYADFERKAGDVLISNQFLAGDRQASPDELQDGIDEAHRRGWIDWVELGWRLTQEGFLETKNALPV